jgi:hypothetical protein
MRFRKTLIFLRLATALVIALPAWAQQEDVGPSGAGPRPNAVRPYVACAAVLTPPAVPQELVAPGYLRVTQPQAPFERVNAITKCRGRVCPTRRSAW